MTLIEIANEKNQVQKNEFDDISKIMYESFILKKKKEDITLIKKKEEILLLFTNFLEKYLELELLNSKKGRLMLINFIDKLNLQKELYELEKGETNIADIQLAGQRLGKKSQSAFKLK